MSDDKKTDVETVASLVDEARALELEDKLAKMSDEEVAAYLATAGVTKADLDESAAREKKLYEQALANGPQSNVVTLASRRKRDAVMVMSSLAVAAALVLMLSAGGLITINPTVPPLNASAAAGGISDQDQKDIARANRYEAFEAFARHEWKESITLFNFARDRDPKGDDAPSIVAARAEARAHMAEEDAGQPEDAAKDGR